jgi:hypothetical protein
MTDLLQLGNTKPLNKKIYFIYQCIVLARAETLVFQVAIQKLKDQDI